jgi:hypothetical protein
MIPVFLFTEIRYLIRHPWTFNWTAWVAWVVITGASFILTRSEKTLGYTWLGWGAAIFIYYQVKIYLNRRRPEVMKRHHQHYYRKIRTQRRR